MSKSGQEWTLSAQLGQLKTGQDGKGLLQIHLWCPVDLPRLWDRLDRIALRTKQRTKIIHIQYCMSPIQNRNFV